MSDFDINSDPSTWTTRDGRKVVIYTKDAPGDYPIHGRVEGNHTPQSWRRDGLFDARSCGLSLDLISPGRRVKVWLYDSGISRYVTSWPPRSVGEKPDGSAWVEEGQWAEPRDKP